MACPFAPTVGVEKGMYIVRSGEGWDFSHVLAERRAVPNFVRDYCFLFFFMVDDPQIHQPWFPALHHPLFF